ncbi:adenylate cyclase [Roseibium aquae]|uniref:Adenylate cyclase n=1 Tax=Roseibium aquae TaxID=1323746 RepID=A0A916X330_9HYPH|nr:adenylate/guanylate cyclase domain-containing protein [Roseibium aquae]GGB58535.1 adenylate cyclase [Roseibium aquae]
MQRAKRRLAAVMCADVAHYSALMERDEDGTLDRLRAYRKVMSGLTARHCGRIVNTWGDAVIIEFSSVIEAVQCAVDIQTDLASRNADLPEAERMEFRIGINLGDLMVEGDDIYGDGVNVAARLQELAPVGGIMLSQAVYEQVRHRLALGFDPLGPRKVKNVSEPVETYGVRLGGRNAPDYGPSRSASQSDHPGVNPQGGAASDDAQGQRLVNGYTQMRAWLQRQPKRVRTSLFMIGFFFFLNLVTSGLSTIWFFWPSLPFILMLAWHFLAGRPRSGDADRSHATD